MDIVLAAATAPRRERGQADQATVEVALPDRADDPILIEVADAGGLHVNPSSISLGPQVPRENGLVQLSALGKGKR